MKSSNTIVTIVVIAAVLIAAYAVGLLIRQSRVGDSPSRTAGEANEALIRQETAKLSHGPGAGQAQDTPEERAKLKAKRAEALQKMESATDEQKMQFRKQVRDSFGDRPGTQETRAPRAEMIPDPNAKTKSNSEGTGSEPNAAGPR